MTSWAAEPIAERIVRGLGKHCEGLTKQQITIDEVEGSMRVTINNPNADAAMANDIGRAVSLFLANNTATYKTQAGDGNAAVVITLPLSKATAEFNRMEAEDRTAFAVQVSGGRGYQYDNRTEGVPRYS